ncbi:DUF4132 domain-containing protein [Gloeocapsopsis dulcis]|uniref:DUF4132 domain-containing protein n=1 Tax=Gloeocapsopsis dulcis AAB1 = 1H9 TaxID=1433147 RepID=A0A6N8G3U7_9CHRO|nr:DUF4132 domain-containing protein [Gloeocapsopsis dulcis]MUL38877.1 hypothetical protein [Gloeocapsopsis dulcis AAB1 = 1H9]WNN89311.1 DUF4132 domain-containing protein [Gloeocapsopsis dulcis]
MEVSTSLQEIALFEREISYLLVDVWQIDQSKNYQHFYTQQGTCQVLLTGEMATLRSNEIINTLSGHTVFGWSVAHDFEQLPTLVQRSLEQLTTRLPITELGRLAADMYFNPMLWQSSYILNAPEYQAVVEILTACLIKFTPPDICDRLATRLTQILANPFYTNEVEIKQRQMICCVPELYLTPTLEDCLALLLELPPSSHNLHLVEQLVLGEWDFGPFDPSAYFGKMYYIPQNFPCYNVDAIYQQQQWQFNFDAYAYPYHFDSCKSIWAYQIYERGFSSQSDKGLCYYFPRLMNRLYEHGRFGYTKFCQAVQHLPLILRDACELTADGSVTTFHAQVSTEFSRVVLEYCEKLARETAQNLSKENYYILMRINKLQGSQYLLEAVRQHNIHQLGLVCPHENKYFRSTNKIKWQDGITAAVVNLAQATDTEPESPTDRQALVAQLQRLPSTSLKYLLPIAQNSQNLLCAALGWNEALPLITTLKIIKQNNANASKVELDLKTTAALRNALVQAGNLGREIWTLWREAKVFDKNTVFLIEAIAGWNCTEIEQSLAKRKQIAVKAYGLLPLERGHEEVLERYLFLQQFQKDSKKFGAEKQANEHTAVQAALAYLAQVAGYSNTQRLESMMEARFNQKIAPESCHWLIGEYQVTLGLSQGDLRLTVHRGDQILKSVPTVVRQSQIYTEIKATVQQLRNQMTRFRRNFEEIMATGQPLSYEELTVFSQIPIAREMLNPLVLLTEDQVCGLFVPDALAIRNLDGELIPLQNQAYIAHPYHLFRRGELAAWQQEIVRQRLVQPFKQVFRELYLLTPAEQETYNYSYRFAGHTLESRVVARLLQSRGWQLGYGEYPVPHKVFAELGLVAYFEFQDVSYYLSAFEEITSDRIYFQADQFTDGTPLPLVDIPPIIFSEVMRDADLVVSVAQREGEARLSQETYQQRGDLIRTLLADLGLANVTVTGHFARVQGKLACYQVHLASAAIHIEPGHHLCVVPERWGKRQKLFLPFTDGGDSKISEVISKILLLANDDKIKDKSILHQIQMRLHE